MTRGILVAFSGVAGLAGVALADIPPGNLMFNSDMEIASGDPAFPQDWFHAASMTDWSTAQAVSPTHSLHIADNDTLASADWRSHGVLVPTGAAQIRLHWHWQYQNIDGEFAVTMRFFDGVDDIGNTTGSFHGETNFFTTQGSLNEWETHDELVTVPKGAGSFDVVIRTLSGAGIGGTGATGEIFVDDVAATVPCRPDFNADGTLNSQDFFDFLNAFFAQDFSADFNGDFVVNSQDFFDYLAAFFAGCA
jgi:hypothetical protein